MTDHVSSGDAASAKVEADLTAFFRHRADVPRACCAPLISSLSELRGSDDPVVTFAGLPKACVPQFADGCQVELSDGTGQPFRARYPPSRAESLQRAAAHPPAEEQMLLTPFRAGSRAGYSPYAGIVTHWWTGRAASDGDAVIADLMIRHLLALVDRERLMAAVARAEDRAASLALQAISGRTINLATGIVMYQQGLPPEGAEDLLRQYARTTNMNLAQVAASIVRSGTPPDSAVAHSKSGPIVRDSIPVPLEVGHGTDSVNRADGDRRLRPRSLRGTGG